ncbi:Tumor necrosis factor receptor superfamily member 5 B-cell surface antigen CD40 CD40L receptor [Collichthys lucidus]|uniref:Tumor necrosis factor receptor superfamily member 5 B-cell surface antigen CD40 CD40L receptor n=1 Tax=Collichthys lucidus TaxID=240159 RepID=A0A4U5V440_COLLU|nr:Tumor necrosis factor receptor superfamily member 5 B-cell surface antigen CD40 CD40L receptor [Collichthys lucidus]
MTMNCTNEAKYKSKDGRCCDRCDAVWVLCCFYEGRMGAFLKMDYISLSVMINVNTAGQCTTALKVKASKFEVGFHSTRTNDTICAPCEKGTYSNVTDANEPCQRYTRCEDIGRMLLQEGTKTTDVVCGDFKSHCHWMLPTALWSGLVLTALVLFGLICWKEKRKSYRAASSITPVTLIEMVPAEPSSLDLDLPLPSTELKAYSKDSCTVDGSYLPLFHPDDNAVNGCIQDSVHSSHPITPLKASVSFVESNHVNGSASYGTGNFFRTYSEPQEDEWCGT